MNRITMKENAKRVIKSHVFISFLVILLYSVISGLPSTLFREKNIAGPAFGGILTFVLWIVLMPMQNGVKLYFYNLTLTGKENFADIIVPYKNGAMGELIKAKLLTTLYIILGTICFIIPGIYMALKYSMVDYAFADNPKIKYSEAMEKSAVLTKGRKGELFILGLSFIGWMFLVILTLGLLIIYVAPYIEASFVQFYLSAKNETEPAVEIIPPQN